MLSANCTLSIHDTYDTHIAEISDISCIFRGNGGKETTANGPSAPGTVDARPPRRSPIQIPLRIPQRSDPLAARLCSEPKSKTKENSSISLCSTSFPCHLFPVP